MPPYGRFASFASTTTPMILQFPLISIIGYCGLSGFRNFLPASITNFLKVASFSPSSFATTSFPLRGSTSGSTSIIIPSGILRPEPSLSLPSRPTKTNLLNSLRLYRTSYLLHAYDMVLQLPSSILRSPS